MEQHWNYWYNVQVYMNMHVPSYTALPLYQKTSFVPLALLLSKYGNKLVAIFWHNFDYGGMY